MRVYEPKRGGGIAERGKPVMGAVIYRKGEPVAEFSYARDAVEYAQRCHDLGLEHLKIVNPSTR